MSTETAKENENKAAINRMYDECWRKHNFSIMDEIISENIAHHGPSVEISGLENYKRYYDEFFIAFPTSKITITEQFVKDDLAVTRWINECVHEKDLGELPATGKRVKVTGIEMVRFEDGKIVESWEEMDQLGMMQQLGMELKPKELAH